MRHRLTEQGTDPGQPSADALLGFGLAAEHDRIGHEAQRVAGSGVGSVGEGGAQTEVMAAAVALQEGSRTRLSARRRATPLRGSRDRGSRRRRRASAQSDGSHPLAMAALRFGGWAARVRASQRASAPSTHGPRSGLIPGPCPCSGRCGQRTSARRSEEQAYRPRPPRKRTRAAARARARGPRIRTATSRL